MNEPEEYIVHDYSAINKQIDELAKRELEISKALRLKNRNKEVKAGIQNAIRYVILLLGLGLFAILFAYAVRLVVYSPLS